MKSLWERLSSVLAPGRRPHKDTAPAGSSAGASPDSDLANRDGSVAIVSGQVSVSEPTGAGRWPVIAPGAKVQVWVDGQPIACPTILQAHQEVRLVAPTLPPQREAHVTIADDHMTASLHLGPGVVTGWQILDSPPAPILSPHAASGETPLPGPDPVAVQTLLERQGVIHGIDIAAIAAALARSDPSTTVVAVATPPLAADPGHISLRLPPTEADRPTPVEPGTVLALCNQAQAGVPGCDVTGTPIPPPAAKATQLVLGHGVGLSPSGQQVVALVAGVPEVEIRDDTVQMAIRPLLVHPGNLSHGSGPVEFDGDVWIDGWVELGCVVHATGSLYVSGGAQGVELIAGHDVQVSSGCIRGVIRQGEARTLTRSLLSDMQELHRQMKDLRHTVRLALSHPRYAQVAGRGGVGPLVQLLVQNRFSRLLELHRNLNALTDQDATATRELVPVLAAVGRIVTGSLGDEDELYTSERDLTSWIDRQDRDVAAAAGRVTIYHLLYSQVYAAGQVEITGPGSEHSDIVAGGPVRVTGQVRGGRIQSESEVRLGRIGAPVGMPTHIAVPAKAAIHIEHAYPGTVCEVGSRSLRLEREVRFVTVRLNEAEQVAFYHD